jgi:hypothetical protein
MKRIGVLMLWIVGALCLILIGGPLLSLAGKPVAGAVAVLAIGVWVVGLSKHNQVLSGLGFFTIAASGFAIWLIEN